MNTKIYYNNQDVFSGICPTPLASKKVEMIRFGERWGQVDNITLQGQITGCDSMAAKVVRQNQLISGFRYSFQTLEIKDDALSVISYPLIELQGINIGESNQKFIIPFTISLRCYPSGYFSGDFGILNPVNRFEFNESEDGIISLNHTVSAKGFNTSTGIVMPLIMQLIGFRIERDGLAKYYQYSFLDLIPICVFSLLESTKID
jgi:hypothetical protein